MRTVDPILNVTYHVSAYDESGYGDNASRNDFTSGEQAIDYAKSLEKRFHAIVVKKITMNPIHSTIWLWNGEE
jgi:hypothetical protein